MRPYLRWACHFLLNFILSLVKWGNLDSDKECFKSLLTQSRWYHELINKYVAEYYFLVLIIGLRPKQDRCLCEVGASANDTKPRWHGHRVSFPQPQHNFKVILTVIMSSNLLLNHGCCPMATNSKYSDGKQGMGETDKCQRVCGEEIYVHNLLFPH